MNKAKTTARAKQPDEPIQPQGTPDPIRNKWTVMFYFAVNNELSPIVISQIQSIKNAGFQKNCDVLVYFDGDQENAPSRLYCVNGKRKAKQGTVIEGYTKLIDADESPFVPNFIEDIVGVDDINSLEKTKRLPSNPEFADKRTETIDAQVNPLERMVNLLKNPDSARATVRNSLSTFLDYGLTKHPAEHFLLVLVGHGMIVGNDMFLPDNEPKSAITLDEFGTVIGEFSASVKGQGGAFELLALQSCSMSALEVAYELAHQEKGSANYLLASEGLSFMNSWPYRHLLKSILVDTDRKAKGETGQTIHELVKEFQTRAIFGAADFMLAGYSSDLSLCSLNKEFYGKEFKLKFEALVKALRVGLKDPNDRRATELIQLAHLSSQSYWGEQYTDLYDFCDRLRGSCKKPESEKEKTVQGELAKACDGVIGILEQRPEAKSADGIVIRSDYFGGEAQYSHGLSIYFPWVMPTDEHTEEGVKLTGKRNVLDLYRKYKFTKAFATNPWIDFLADYWLMTRREKDTVDESSKITGQKFRTRTVIPMARAAAVGVLTGDKTSAAGGFGRSFGSPIKNFARKEQLINVHGECKSFPMSERIKKVFNDFSPPIDCSGNNNNHEGERKVHTNENGAGQGERKP
jgi:hypothetical protein